MWSCWLRPAGCAALSLPLAWHFLYTQCQSSQWEVATGHHTFMSELLLELLGLFLRLLCRGLQASRALLASLYGGLELDINADLLRLEVIVCARLGLNLGEQGVDKLDGGFG
jgi:peptidoglycan/LPS O-acetylase OafA/YrhL